MIRWLNYLADLISGRVNNTLVSQHNRLRRVEIEMTKNQETINNVAQELTAVSDEFDAGIQALKDEIEGGTAPEDLDFSALEAVADKLKTSADALVSAPAGTAGTEAANSTDAGPVATPIDSTTDLPPTPLAGSSGPTDAGVPTEVQAPGNPNLDPQTTPVVEDATADAGLGSSTEVPQPEPLPATDADVPSGTTTDDTESTESPNENPTGEAPTGDSSASSAGGTEGASTIPASSPSTTEAGSQSSPTAPTSGSGDEFDD